MGSGGETMAPHTAGDGVGRDVGLASSKLEGKLEIDTQSPTTRSPSPLDSRSTTKSAQAEVPLSMFGPLGGTTHIGTRKLHRGCAISVPWSLHHVPPCRPHFLWWSRVTRTHRKTPALALRLKSLALSP